MPSPFNITAVTPIVQLDSHRRGEASYTVSNAIGRPIRGRAQLVVLDQARLEWLTLVGEAERDFSASGTQQYTVTIQVPDTATAGDYTFRLDMVGVENPDDLYSQGQPVTFNVPPGAPPPPPPPEKDKGYVTAIVGAVIGVLAGIAAGVVIGFILVLILTAVIKSADLGTALALIFLPLILLTGLGVWLGMALGVWLALKIRKYDWAGITGIIVGVVLPVWSFIIALLLSGLGNALKNNIIQGIIALIALGLFLVVPALIARAITLQWKTGHI